MERRRRENNLSMCTIHLWAHVLMRGWNPGAVTMTSSIVSNKKTCLQNTRFWKTWKLRPARTMCVTLSLWHRTKERDWALVVWWPLHVQLRRHTDALATHMCVTSTQQWPFQYNMVRTGATRIHLLPTQHIPKRSLVLTKETQMRLS